MELISPGLCGTCRWCEVVRSSRDSVFYRCGLHGRRPGFERYPRLPVVECSGHEAADAPAGDDSDDVD